MSRPASVYGDRRDYRKVDIFRRGPDGRSSYVASTTWSRTCREAVAEYSGRYGVPATELWARFDK